MLSNPIMRQIKMALKRTKINHNQLKGGKNARTGQK
jgi:hypothetical protein